jgi:hypothetical protein
MSIKALITTLVLGSSSVALAKPVVVISGSAQVTLGTKVRDVRDHRAPDCHDPAPVYTPPVVLKPVRPLPIHQPWFNPQNTIVGTENSVYTGSIGRSAYLPNAYLSRPAQWFQLTEATRIDSGREFFKIAGDAGFFKKLHLKNLGGRTEITMVGLEFKQNGRTYVQKVQYNGLLSSSGLTINLERDSRTLNRIIVYGTSGRGSAYQMLAL